MLVSRLRVQAKVRQDKHDRARREREGDHEEMRASLGKDLAEREARWEAHEALLKKHIEEGDDLDLGHATHAERQFVRTFLWSWFSAARGPGGRLRGAFETGRIAATPRGAAWIFRVDEWMSGSRRRRGARRGYSEWMRIAGH